LPLEHANGLVPCVAAFQQAFVHPSSLRLRTTGASFGLRLIILPKLHLPAKRKAHTWQLSLSDI
jgi:hypothetical protein